MSCRQSMRTSTALRLLAAAAALSVVATAPGATEVEPPPPSARARALLGQMTLGEKITMLHGCQPVGKAPCGPYPDNTLPIPRLGIPAQSMCDGPQGMRGSAGTTTQWPAGLAIAASFDRSAARRWGTGMGAEFAAKGCSMQLGPGVCVARVPTNGRNFEYSSGSTSPVTSRVPPPRHWLPRYPLNPSMRPCR